MAQNYRILKKNSSRFTAVVVGLSSESLTDYFAEIADSLAKINVSGKILLDYLSYNRSKKRRFCEIDFNGKAFIFSSLKRASIDEDTKIGINKLYNAEHLLPSFLID